MSTLQVSPLIVILAACDEEVSIVSRHMVTLKRLTLGDFVGQLGLIDRQRLGVVRTGMGPERAVTACQAVIDNLQPSFIMSLGSCAGLTEEMGPGEIACLQTVANNSQLQPSAAFLEAFERCQGQLSPFLRSCCHKSIFGDSSKVLTTRDEKLEFAESGAQVVDMESVAIGQCAQKAGIAWGSLRVVSDGLDDNLPMSFDNFLDEKHLPDKKRILWHCLSHPSLIVPLLNFGTQVSLASDRLGEFLPRLLKEFKF